MQNEYSLIVRFGTSEPVPSPISLMAGPLSVEIIDGSPRGLRWHGVEVVRAINCPIRDTNWGTYAPQFPEENTRADSNGFEFERRFWIANSALSCRLTYAGRADGFFRAVTELTAHLDFSTNRAGLTLLHPIAGLAGSPLEVRHPDGSSARADFPELISPHQPVLNIAGLIYSLEGIEVNITFTGETFEMEDQRNWTDASYKTYCRPLSLPFPYFISKGETVRQEIEIHLKGNNAGPQTASKGASEELRFSAAGEKVPVIALALDMNSPPDAAEARIIRRAAPRALQLRVRPETLGQIFSAAQALIGDDEVEITLEIVVPERGPIEECLEEFGKMCSRYSVRPVRVIALPEAYLRSYQPAGPWPDGPTPRDAAVAARRCFPGARIGSGVLTNFAELNRCRPDLSVCDYITHDACAIIHGADDRSVVENLEGLSHVFTSGRALAGDRDYHLGLVSIGMRFNAYGPDVISNPSQVRSAMNRIDPRQRGLFAAAWAVGAVAVTEQQSVSSMALGCPVGPFGIVYRKGSWPQPIFDELTSGAVYPLFHVVRALSQIGGARRLALGAVPRGVFGVAGQTERGKRLLLTNTSNNSCTVSLPHKARVRKLDEDTFETAISDPDWLVNSEAEWRADLILDSLNVAFVDFPGAGAGD